MRSILVASAFVSVMLLLVAPALSPLPAQSKVYIPDNLPGVGGTNAYPFSYKPEWRYQILVNSSFLPSAAFKIMDVAISARQTATFTASQCQIRVCNTTLKDFQPAANRNFNTNLFPCPTQVHNGPIKFATTANQWSNLGLQTSHGHDGTRNLLIEIRYTGGSQNVSVRMTTNPACPRRLWNFSTGSYNATTGSVDPLTVSGAPKLCLTIDRSNVLLCPDTASIGTSAPIQLVQATPAHFYQMAASLSRLPFQVGPCRLFLTPDNVFVYSVRFGAPIFNNYTGQISAAGSATGKFSIPGVPALIGICVYHAAVTYTAKGISGCTNTCGMQLTK